MAREHLFTMRMGSDERDRLVRLADHVGISAAELIRMLVKLKANEILGGT